MAKKQSKRANGEGTLRQRKDGIWEAAITTGRDSSGRLIRKSFYGKTQTIAKEKRDKYLTEVRTGTYTEPSTLTVGQLIGDWLRVFCRPNKKPATYAKYDSVYRIHIVDGIGHILIQNLTTRDLQVFYNSINRSTSTISIIHIVINGSLEYAVDQNLIKKNPAKKTKRPTVTYKKITPMTEEELEKFLSSAVKYRMFAAFFVDLSTGIRRGELCALRWARTDLTNGVLKIRESLNRIQIAPKKTELRFDNPKTKRATRDIPLLPDTIEVLKVHKAHQEKEKEFWGEMYQDNDLVFCTELGKPCEPRNLLRTLKLILTKANLRQDITIHNLRHTFTTALLKKRVSLKHIIDLLGHVDERMIIRTYGHSDDSDLISAIQELKGVIKIPEVKEKPSQSN